MRKPIYSIPSLYVNLPIFLIKMTILLSCFLGSLAITAQNNELLNGHWQLQKVSFKKSFVENTEKNKEQLLDVFKAALYEDLTAEQRLTLEDLEWMNAEAELLLEKYYQTTMEFQPNGAFYNTSQNISKSLSGEYILNNKRLLLEWETAEKSSLKILKSSSSELVLKDRELKIKYHYIKLDQKKSMNYQQ